MSMLEYSDKFKKMMPLILTHEGGWVNNPNDPGGATNYGISLRLLLQIGDLSLGDINHDGRIDWHDIKDMQPQDAIEIYWQKFYKPYQAVFDGIDDYYIALKLFDLGINMGQVQANMLLQRACRACGISLVEDGAIGSRSITAINILVAANHNDALFSAFCSETAGFYRSLAAGNSKFKEFLTGWLNRAYDQCGNH